MTLLAVTLFPEPDSPTRASVSPFLTSDSLHESLVLLPQMFRSGFVVFNR